MHQLGSRRWNDANWPCVQSLGEDLTCRQPYDRGNPPVKIPSAVRIGDPDCIAGGELVSHAIDKLTLFDGIPPLCFTSSANDIVAITSTIFRCSLQRLYATIIYYQYADDEATIRAIFSAWVGTELTVTYVPATDSLPCVVVARNELVTVVILDGTRNYQTYAWQAFNLIVRPANIGAFGTLNFWYNSATYVNTILVNLGVDAGVPIMLAGHSYGGAVAQILAGRYRVESATRVIRCLTYGAPKPGDARLSALLAQCEVLNLANGNDFTPVAPPDYPTLIPVLTVVGLASLLSWNQWDKPPNVYLQNEAGELLPDSYPTLDFPTLLEFTTRAIASIPQSPIAGHPILEYLRRITLRCPGVDWPLNQAAANKINVAFQQLNLHGWTPKRTKIVWNGTRELAPAPAGGALQLGSTKVPTAPPAAGSFELFGHQPYDPPRGEGLIGLGGGEQPTPTPAAGRLNFVGGFVTPPAAAAGLVELLGEAAWQTVPAGGRVDLGGVGALPTVPAGGRVELFGSSTPRPTPAAGTVVLIGEDTYSRPPATGALYLRYSPSLRPAPATGALGLFGGSRRKPLPARGALWLNGEVVKALPAAGVLSLHVPAAADRGRLESGGYSIAKHALVFTPTVGSEYEGATCDDAIDLVDNDLIDFELVPTFEKWFRFSMLAGETLRITPTVLVGIDASIDVKSGASCAGLTPIVTFNFTSGFQDVGALTDTNFYLRVYHDSFLGGTFRLEVEVL